MRVLPSDRDLGWTPFAWLIYLGIFIVNPVLKGAGPLEWTLTVIAVLVFLPLYFMCFWRGSVRRHWAVIGGILLLGVLYVPFNDGASVFFVYAAAGLGFFNPVRVAVYALAGIVLVLIVESLLLGLGPGAWMPGIVFSLLIGGINIHFGEVERRNFRLKLAQEEVEDLAKLDERERIARDLHDLLGHSLSMITIKSELAGRLIEQEPADLERSAAEIRDVEEASRQAMSQVRRAVRGYRAQKLSTELAKCRMTLEAAGIEMEFESGPYDLNPDQESVLALALRESVTNVVRHSRASRCRIVMRTLKGRFELAVSDNGRGIQDLEGSGLTGMRERVTSIGGTVDLENLDRGASVLVTLPTSGKTPTATSGVDTLERLA